MVNTFYPVLGLVAAAAAAWPPALLGRAKHGSAVVVPVVLPALAVIPWSNNRACCCCCRVCRTNSAKVTAHCVAAERGCTVGCCLLQHWLLLPGSVPQSAGAVGCAQPASELPYCQIKQRAFNVSGWTACNTAL